MTTEGYDVPEIPPALGSVVEEGRGSLPFALIHGEGLVACAAWALGDAGVTAVDLGTPWAALVDSGEPFVLHDALCPMTPAHFIADCVNAAVERDAVVVGAYAHPGSMDRAEQVAVASPVVLPTSVVAVLNGLPTLDFTDLVTELRVRFRFPVAFAEAPPSAARVRSVDDVRDLEELTRPIGP